MEELGLLSKYIQEYGPLVVILAVFLAIVFALVMYLLNTNKKSIQSNTEMANKITAMFQEELKKNAKLMEQQEQKHYDERNIVTIFTELNKTLKTACERIMRQSGSDRVAIYVFHNGAHASHGLPFFKMTCISETISKNSNANMKMLDHGAMQLNLFDTIVDGLYDNSYFRIVVDQTTDPSELIFLKNTKIKDCFFIPIYDDDNNMMGFTFNGYNTPDNTRNIETEKEYLVDLAMMAKPVIEYSKFQEYQSNKEE